jgi:ketosteroid isomerase-like protein
MQDEQWRKLERVVPNGKGGVAMNEKEILEFEDKRFGAMIARDFKALEAMVHGDLLYTHSSGVTDTKATWLQSMQSGKTKYKSVNCTDRKVRVIGEVALVTGRAAIEAEIGGQPRSLKLLFLNAWAKTPQGWKFVAWQSTPLAA